MFNASPLPERAVLKISGDDARSFLQGLISNDIHKLTVGRPLYAALLSPQGKTLHDFMVMEHGNALWLDSEATSINALRQRLLLYKLRANVVVEYMPDWQVWALWGSIPLASTDNINMAQVTDPRLEALGARIIGLASTVHPWFTAKNATISTPQAYLAHRLLLGVPNGSRDFIHDKTLLLEMGMEALHGVDFNKGCYVGQEVTARSKFRSTLRKQLVQVTSTSGNLPLSGTAITSGDKTVGELRSVHHHIGLAMLQSEALALPLMAGDVALSAHIPTWWQAKI